MMNLHITLQRTQNTGSGIAEAVDVLDAEETTTERAIRCAVCDYNITHAAAKMQNNGAHAHEFTNPSRITFQIGCFSEADGVALFGPASDQWSWFPPYLWRIASCRDCGNHLGWRFECDSDIFFGLILDRLIDE